MNFQCGKLLKSTSILSRKNVTQNLNPLIRQIHLRAHIILFLAKRINSCDVWYCFSVSSTVGNFAEQSTLCELSPSACERSHMSIAVLVEAGGAQSSEISVRASFCRTSRDDALCRRSDPSTPTRVWFTFGAAPEI